MVKKGMQEPCDITKSSKALRSLNDNSYQHDSFLGVLFQSLQFYRGIVSKLCALKLGHDAKTLSKG